jgi:DNA-binding MarR family transcriptional regulator
MTADEETHALATDLARVAGGLMRRLRAASQADRFTPSQRSALPRRDAGGPTTIAELARAELVRPQSMRATVGALEERGILSRSPHPTDGRQVVLSLTDDGRAALAELRRAKYDWLARTLDDRLDPAERETLAQATELMKRLMHE